MNLSSYIEAEFRVQNVNIVLHRHYPAGWKHSINCRKQCALYYIEDGIMEIRTGGKTYRVPPDSIILMNHGCGMDLLCGAVGSRGTLDSYQICFFSDTLFSDVGLPFILPSHETYLPRFEEAYACWSGHSAAYRIRTRAMLENIIASLLTDAAEAQGMHTPTRKLTKLLEYIHTHCSEGITTEDMCRIANYSPSHIRRIFCHEFGMPPLKYVNRVRIRRACELLQDDNTPICRIAEAVGFDNAPYFTRVFREIMHMTPGEYRRAAAKDSIPSLTE